MVLGTQFGKNIDLMHRELSAVKFRQDVIANNIANQDTPNFKRSTVNFETHLKEALLSEKHVEDISAVRTNPNHVNFFDPIDYKSVSPRRTLDWQTQANNNGNNVNIEQEVIDNLKWTQVYELLSSVVSKEFKNVSIVLGG